MKYSIKDFFSKFDHIPRKLQIWSHLLQKSLMEIVILCALSIRRYSVFSKLTTTILFTNYFYSLRIKFLNVQTWRPDALLQNTAACQPRQHFHCPLLPLIVLGTHFRFDIQFIQIEITNNVSIAIRRAYVKPQYIPAKTVNWSVIGEAERLEFIIFICMPYQAQYQRSIHSLFSF